MQGPRSPAAGVHTNVVFSPGSGFNRAVNLKEEILALEQVTDRLCLRFPTAGREEVTGVVQALYREFDGLPVRSYIPVLIEREALQQLRGRRTLTHVGAGSVVAG